MVSHGVDVNRLNLMLFNGMPRSMAEYIQASSRVGRAHLGVVFMIFNADPRARPIPLPLPRQVPRVPGPDGRARRDQPVEPLRGPRARCPGILMGQVLQVANRAWWDAGTPPATSTT